MLCKSQVIRVASNNKHNVPYNIASYATLALILEKITGYKALAIQGNLNKVHLYDNSLGAVKEQLNRDVDKYEKCELSISNGAIGALKTIKDLDLLFSNGIRIFDFELQNYESYSHIKVEMLERDK